MEALALVRGLQERYPRNPLFRQIEAEILDVYVHDAAGSLEASQDLLDAAEHGEVNRAELAAVRARLNMAVQLDRAGPSRSCARHARQRCSRRVRTHRSMPWSPRARCSARGRRGSAPTDPARSRRQHRGMEGKIGLAKTRSVDNHKTLSA